jgi:DNA-binding XRE family transcriptional regulator
MAAARWLRAGLSQAEVARKVGVHRQSVSRWARELEAAGRPGSVRPSCATSNAHSSAGPRRSASAAGSGPPAGCATSSHTAPGCDTTRPTSGASCASSTGVASVPPGERWNATSQRSGTGRSTVGRRLKKSAPPAANHRLRRPKWSERTPASGADLGTARTDPGPAISLQLEGAVGCCRDHLVELLLPALSPHYPRRGSRGLPGPSAAPPAGQAPGGVGRTAGASRASGQRVYRRPARPTRDRATAGVCSGTQSGGIHLGLLEASRTTQLLPSRLRRTELSGAARIAPHASAFATRPLLLASSALVTMICRVQ